MAELEQAVSRLSALNEMIGQREAAVAERERVVAAKEHQVAEELAKIQAIRVSLATLLDGSRQP